MRFTFDYDRTEFVRAQRAAAKHADTPVLKWAPVVLGALAAAFAVGAAFIPDGRWAVFLLRLVPWLMIGAVWFVLFARFLGPAAARQYEKQQQDSRHPHGAAFHEDAYEATSFSGTTQRHWHAFQRVVETREFLLLYFTKQFAYYLPKRAIPSEEELQAVRRLLREKLGDRAKLMDAA